AGLRRRRRTQLDGVAVSAARPAPCRHTFLLIAQHERDQLAPADISQQADQPGAQITGIKRHAAIVRPSTAICPLRTHVRADRLPRNTPSRTVMIGASVNHLWCPTARKIQIPNRLSAARAAVS